APRRSRPTSSPRSPRCRARCGRVRGSCPESSRTPSIVSLLHGAPSTTPLSVLLDLLQDRPRHAARGRQQGALLVHRPEQRLPACVDERHRVEVDPDRTGVPRGHQASPARPQLVHPGSGESSLAPDRGAGGAVPGGDRHAGGSGACLRQDSAATAPPGRRRGSRRSPAPPMAPPARAPERWRGPEPLPEDRERNVLLLRTSRSYPVDGATARHAASSAVTCASFASTRATQSAPSSSRSGGSALLTTAMMAAAASTGSPG